MGQRNGDGEAFERSCERGVSNARRLEDEQTRVV